MYASNSHSYTHLILVLGIGREPTVWGFITSKYSYTNENDPVIDCLAGQKRVLCLHYHTFDAHFSGVQRHDPLYPLCDSAGTHCSLDHPQYYANTMRACRDLGVPSTTSS